MNGRPPNFIGNIIIPMWTLITRPNKLMKRIEVGDKTTKSDTTDQKQPRSSSNVHGGVLAGVLTTLGVELLTVSFFGKTLVTMFHDVIK